MATARSNKVATTLAIQDFSQLKKDYGKIMQDRESFSINRMDTSISRSMQMEAAIPPSKIATLSSGEFVGCWLMLLLKKLY